MEEHLLELPPEWRWSTHNIECDETNANALGRSKIMNCKVRVMNSNEAPGFGRLCVVTTLYLNLSKVVLARRDVFLEDNASILQTCTLSKFNRPV